MKKEEKREEKWQDLLRAHPCDANDNNDMIEMHNICIAVVSDAVIYRAELEGSLYKGCIYSKVEKRGRLVERFIKSTKPRFNSEKEAIKAAEKMAKIVMIMLRNYGIYLQM